MFGVIKALTGDAVFRRILLPLLLFSLLSASACKLILGNLFSSGLAHSIATECPSHNTRFMLPYTGIHIIDSGLCGMVFFFQEAMSTPESTNLLIYFVGTGTSFVAFPVFNSYRARTSWFIAYPVIWGFLTQTVTVGVTMPLYWLAIILTGGFKKRTKTASITQAQAQAAIFGIIVGAVIPSIGMLVLNDSYVTAIWQLYPFYVSLAQQCHLYLRAENGKPGSFMVQVAYITSFIISSSTHISIVWPILSDPIALKTLFVPSVTPVASTEGTAIQILDFLKWDLLFGFGSTIVATLWTSNNLQQLYGLCAWYIFATPIIGPGSAILGTVLWYEFGRSD